MPSICARTLVSSSFYDVGIHPDASFSTAKQSISNGVVRISLIHWHHSLHMVGVSSLGAYHGVQYSWAYLAECLPYPQTMQGQTLVVHNKWLP